MKIPKITAYMREKGARYVGELEERVLWLPAKTKLFADKDGELIATLKTISFSNSQNQVVHQTLLETINGMSKFTSKVVDFIKLKNFKGKENVKFPYSIDSETQYGKTGVKKSFFFIKDGVTFLKTDKDGIMIYETGTDFKTAKVGFMQGTSE